MKAALFLAGWSCGGGLQRTGKRPCSEVETVWSAVGHLQGEFLELVLDISPFINQPRCHVKALAQVFKRQHQMFNVESHVEIWDELLNVNPEFNWLALERTERKCGLYTDFPSQKTKICSQRAVIQWWCIVSSPRSLIKRSKDLFTAWREAVRQSRCKCPCVGKCLVSHHHTNLYFKSLTYFC